MDDKIRLRDPSLGRPDLRGPIELSRRMKRGNDDTAEGGKRRIHANFDLFNIFNVSPVLALNNSYGSTWHKPSTILQGRLMKFGVQMEF